MPMQILHKCTHQPCTAIRTICIFEPNCLRYPCSHHESKMKLVHHFHCGSLTAGSFGTAIMENPQVLVALELTRQAVMSLPQAAGNIRNQFLRFSHLWTRPMTEALQVQALYCVQPAASCNCTSSMLLFHSGRRFALDVHVSGVQEAAKMYGMHIGVHGARGRLGRGWNTRCAKPG